MGEKKALVWLRHDLRLHDQVALKQAQEQADVVYLAYCLDTREYEQLPLGFRKTESRRMQFLLESLADLRQAAEAQGGSVFVREGVPAEEIPALARTLGVGAVYVSEEAASDEIADEAAVEKGLWQEKIPLHRIWQSTLFHREDIPWPMGNLPDVFTQFRKETEKEARVRPTVAPPKALSPPPEGVEVGELPTLQALGYTLAPTDARAVLDFRGGEKAAKDRLNHYFWEADALRQYKETRNGMLGANYSAKLSPWLSLGCLSPRTVYEEVKAYEAERTKNQSTYWLLFELMWRDYFRFVSRKYDARMFRPLGIKGKERGLDMRTDYGLFEKWRLGQTGVPFIDANMRELYQTGYMSNRGRQNVASFLVKDLGLDWRWGAAWFEAQLIDYDVASNWGNWNYVAGVGNDPRENRYFNILSQAKRYDGRGDYVRVWVPELAKIDGGKIHVPDQLPKGHLLAQGIELGSTYPLPVIDTAQWIY